MSKQGAEGAERFGRFLVDFLARSARFPNASAFADAAGISRSAVSRWVNGKERPAAGALPKIAPLMGVSGDQLFAIAYPELADEDTGPITPPLSTFEQVLADTGLSEDQRQIIRALHDQFVRDNRAKTTKRRPRRTGTAHEVDRPDDERPAI